MRSLAHRLAWRKRCDDDEGMESRGEDGDSEKRTTSANDE